MLTIDMLKQSADLSGLTDVQFKAIADMSRNDENNVIGARIGELHGLYDKDILEATGVKKAEGEKSYEYVKRVLGDLKKQVSSYDSVKAELNAAKGEVEKLKKALEESSGDELLRTQLNDAKVRVTQLQKELTDKVNKIQAMEKKYEADLKDAKVDFEFQVATNGFKFKSGIPENIQGTLISAAKSEVLSKGTPDFIDDEKGAKKLVFRDSSGNILNNPKNNLNPYTLQELIMETSISSVLDTTVIQHGGGTGGNGGAGGGWNTGQSIIDISGAKNQIEADKIIESYLLSNGYTRDSEQFSEQSMKLRTDNGVDKLPIR